MNELQLTLLVLALAFVGGLYWMSQKKKSATAADAKTAHSEQAPSQQPQQHSPLMDPPAEPSAQTEGVPPEQASLFDEPAPVFEENGKKVLQVDDAPDEDILPVEVQPSFGKPQHQTEAEAPQQDVARSEPQVFSIMLLGTHEYTLQEIHSALRSFNVAYDAATGFYCLVDEDGHDYVRIVNALNPGVIPPLEEDDGSFRTPGIALVLGLPTTIHAPRAMEEMLTLARKLSQKLDATMYDINRTRLREPDLQRMRSAALDYVSKPVGNME
ncbi:ZipA, C-terminal FtsZ-binding domain [Sulfurivirga caldicuralii]|uniref:Cell division protein ZipA n=1 Tax=Sulfurivirga caldicuralii TaxID=364032 RepID=A0A1N6FEQ2_9GAMM|nr:cell division protein ZipA C-terminal FtsZ-binding domain-containing protein [Sulfurivirga caldicuralii]SIN93686.1 ZipA, C-terminal FtsZ-binding domain [Sulfurivirga caldicuralii]